MGPACPNSGQIVTLEGTILNHTHTTSMVWPHAYLSSYSVAHGIPYVIGETNSLYVSLAVSIRLHMVVRN